LVTPSLGYLKGVSEVGFNSEIPDHRKRLEKRVGCSGGNGSTPKKQAMKERGKTKTRLGAERRGGEKGDGPKRKGDNARNQPLSWGRRRKGKTTKASGVTI